MHELAVKFHFMMQYPYHEMFKRYARLTDPYDETVGQFNCEFNVITGLVNLHLL